MLPVDVTVMGALEETALIPLELAPVVEMAQAEVTMTAPPPV